MDIRKILVSLGVVSAFLLALPVVGAAQEIEVDNASSFSGTSGAFSLVTNGEPVFTEELTHITGSFNSPTTGSFEVDVTGCHITILGSTLTCRTAGSPLNNTIRFGGTFHMITINEKPAMLLTITPFTISGPLYNPFEVKGAVIGTVTSPACNGSSNVITVKFSGAGATQEHKLYTGVNYDLTMNTEGHSASEASWTIELALSSPTSMKLTCQ